MHTLDYILEKWDVEVTGKNVLYVEDRSRDDLADLFADLGYKEGAEIGTRRGDYARTLCKANPGLKLHCVDPYLAYPLYRDCTDQNVIDKQFATAAERLKHYNCSFLKQYSMDAVKSFAPESLDFVAIDGNHRFEYVVNDIIEWSKIVRRGHICSGHDYFRSKTKPFHVSHAVDAYVKANRISPLIVLKKVWPPSWLFVKP
jgi:hypothetical protein